MARTPTASMVQHLPLTQARINLGAVVKRVHLNKQYVVLEKDGIPVAGVMPIDEFEDYLELQHPTMRAHIRKSNAEYLAGKSRRADEFLAELRQKVKAKAKAKPPRRRA